MVDQGRREPRDHELLDVRRDAPQVDEGRLAFLDELGEARPLRPQEFRLVDVVEAFVERLGDRPLALEYIERALQNGYSLDDIKSTPEFKNLVSDPNFRPNGKK